MSVQIICYYCASIDSIILQNAGNRMLQIGKYISNMGKRYIQLWLSTRGLTAINLIVVFLQLFAVGEVASVANARDNV